MYCTVFVWVHTIACRVIVRIFEGRKSIKCFYDFNVIVIYFALMIVLVQVSVLFWRAILNEVTLLCFFDFDANLQIFVLIQWIILVLGFLQFVWHFCSSLQWSFLLETAVKGAQSVFKKMLPYSSSPRSNGFSRDPLFDPIFRAGFLQGEARKCTSEDNKRFRAGYYEIIMDRCWAVVSDVVEISFRFGTSIIWTAPPGKTLFTLMLSN